MSIWQIQCGIIEYLLFVYGRISEDKIEDKIQPYMR